MSPAAPLAFLDTAEQYLQRARQSWSTATSAGRTECLHYLGQAIAGIEQGRSMGFDRLDAHRLKGRLVNLREEIASLGRLIDGSTAFFRGLSLQTGMEEGVAE
ncbi:MAG: hypothetical protein C5B51_09785 [Terriglobia bacterium]|nr:MAG: hypothetical protein C5B51_09785 [Terriglobia bacterium]